MTKIFSSPDKQIIMSVLDQKQDIIYGYNMRTEEYIARKRSEMVEESVNTIFKHIGFNEKSLIGRIAALLNLSNIQFEDISKASGLSIRTIHRYINLNQ